MHSPKTISPEETPLNHINPNLNNNPHCITTLKSSSNINNNNIATITCLAVNHNLLYAAFSNRIDVFDLSSDHYIQVDTFNDTTKPSSGSGSVKSIAFYKSKLFTAHQDSKIRIWHITPSKRHRLVATLPTVKDRLLRFILPKNYIQVRRHKKRLWIEHYDAVSGLVVNRDGLMYSVSWDRSFKIWDVEGQRCLESVKAHDDAVNAIVVSDNGIVYTASADGHIRVWERDDKTRKHTLITTLYKHKSTVTSLALNGDGTVLFSGGHDRPIIVWEKKINCLSSSSMKFMEKLEGHAGAILCLNSVGDIMLSGSSDRTVRIWRRAKESGGHRCMEILKGHDKPVKSIVTVLGDDKSNGVALICSGSLDGEIKVWEVSIISSLNYNRLSESSVNSNT